MIIKLLVVVVVVLRRLVVVPARTLLEVIVTQVLTITVVEYLGIRKKRKHQKNSMLKITTKAVH